MKLLVIGDSHGNIANIKHVMGFAKKIKAEAIIHTGDWGNLENVETVLEYKIPVFGVLGNADIDPRFNFKEELEFIIDNLKIGVCHSIKNYKLKIENLDVVFCGHTHKQGQENNIINPGALENGINFAIFDTKTKMVEFIHG